MKTVLLCFVLFVLFAVNAQAQKTLERVNPDSDTLQLVIDIDETVRIEIAPSDKKTSSVTIKTNVKEVTVQRDDTKYVVKKVKLVSHNTPQTTKKPNPPTATPTPAHDESNAFRLSSSSSSFAACLSLIAVACHLVFVGERKWVATTTTVLLLVIFALCSSGSTFVNASTESDSKAQVTVRVYLPENVQTLKITQKNGRKGLIDVVGDPSSPLAINTFRFTTSTNTQLTDITFSSCSRVFIQSQANVLVDNFQAPMSGSCSITFKAGKQMLATMADGYLGSFTLSCQQGSKNNKQNNACYTNAVGSAVKHSTSSFTTSVNTTEGDTLCTGATGYNILSASGTKVNVDFGSSADCFPVVMKSNPPNAGTPFVQPSTSALPASPAVSSLPASKSAIPPASASTSVAPASASTSAAPASASTSVAPASASTSAAPASASTSAAPASASPSSWVESACRTVNGIRWCYNPSKCGESCEDVCKFFGFSITIDDTTWFNAQNDLTKCRNIASAFGISSVNLDVWSYGCLEDAPGIHSDPSKLIGSLYCSTLDTCPGKHRTTTDQLGADCATESRKSICPCQ